MITAPLPLDPARLTSLGQMLASRFEDYERDRQTAEQQWMKNLRQFRGIYDPEIEKLLDPTRSKAYPKLTRQKVIGTVARLMEMLFPRTEKNWTIEPSPKPDLDKAKLDALLQELQAKKSGADLTNAEIEKAIRLVAQELADRMATTIDDQLAENEYVTLARRVVFSGVLYGIGLLEGPLIRAHKTRKWERDPSSGRYRAVEQEKLVPYAAFVRVWDFYPDFSAKEWQQQDGYFRRHILTRAGVRELADRADFLGERVLEWLQRNDKGNYRERSWECEVRSKKSDRENVKDLSGRKYEAISWTGQVSGHDLRAAGVNIPEDKLSDMHEGVVWMLDGVVIKCRLNPFEKPNRMIHAFIFEEDDINLTGQGLPQILRDSQMGACEAIRMAYDNGSVVCGPITEVDLALLADGQDPTIHAYKTYFRDPNADPSITKEAVRSLRIDSHIDELLALYNVSRETMETEAALPPPSLGDVTQGGSEAMRTKGNLSMIMGAAALPIRDTVRNFDAFTTSFIGALYDWNMEFNDDPSIKGDYVVIARGSTSLIAKEVRAAGLDYMAQTLQPEERIYLNGKRFLLERLKVRDIDYEDLLEDDDVVAQKQEAQAQMMEEERQSQMQLVDAQVREIMSSIVKNMALAKKASTGADTDVYKALMEAINSAADIDVKDRAAKARSRGSAGKQVA